MDTGQRPNREEARAARHSELSRLTKRALISRCLARGIMGGTYPLQDWTRDDLIASLLHSEFPTPDPTQGGHQ